MSYFTDQRRVQQFADDYRKLCEKYVLHIVPGLSAITIEHLEHCDTLQHNLQTAVQTYLDILYDI